jgi:hypothetical protein
LGFILSGTEGDAVGDVWIFYKFTHMYNI